MTGQRQAHGVQFVECPECQTPIGQRGLARHREQAHGVAPVVRSSRKPRTLSTAQATDLRIAIRDGAIPTTAIAFGSLLKFGFVTETGRVTDAGRARLA